MALPLNKTRRVRYDGLENYLAADLSSNETTSTIRFARVLEADGGKVIAPLAEDEYLVLAILTPNYVLSEIVYLISYDPDADPTTGTVTRGEEGTSIASHGVEAKVVHAPTAMDYNIFEDHLTDAEAHKDLIAAIADQAAASAIRGHVAEADPHPQYLRKDDLIIPDGDTLVIENGATLWVKHGATLKVDGTLDITAIGTLIVNGHQIVVSPTEPVNPPANMVWIKTFGA